MNLSPHFTLEEAIASETAARQEIPNTPSTEILVVMQRTAIEMEKVRGVMGVYPFHINSWYRSPQLNALIGSKPTSQHIKGEAVDFICSPFGSPADICKRVIWHKELIPFDQIILEHTWVHISFAIASGKPRGQVLSLLSTGGYSIGLTDKQGNPIE